jgi:energy-coupling factor transporter ATP-binding protein EcfA2
MSDDGRGWLRLVVPRDNTSAPFTAEQLYAAIHAGTGRQQATQIVLVGTATDVGIWLRAEAERLDPLGAMVRATYPDAELERIPPDLPTVQSAGSAAGARWQLVHEAAYPIKTVRAFEHSEPMAMTLGALAEARVGECGALSLVLTRAPAAFARRSLALTRALVTGTDAGPVWQRSLSAPFDVLAHLLNAVLAPTERFDSGPPTPNADLEARVKWIAGKAAQPAFRATIRTAWLAPTMARAAAGHAGLVSALGQFAVVGQNALTPKATAPNDAWAGVLSGTPGRRERVILAIDELAGLVHCPGPELVVPHLRRTRARRRAAPTASPADALTLADTAHRDGADPVGVSVRQLMSHAYLVGPSGTGKTTLLTTLVLALADAGAGAVVLDPHGDLARQTLLRMPREQLDRVLLFDLADPANLPTLNPLWVPPGAAAEQAVARAVRSAAVTAVFADVWGLHRATAPNLMHFLEAAIAALVASGKGCLAVLPRFLTDGAYRAAIVRAAGDPRVTARWAEFAALSPDDRSRTVRAILNKAADFDRNPLLGTVFGDPGPGLRLDHVMDANRILIVSLPRGLVPEGTVELVGSLLVSLIYQAALAREARPPEQRPPVVAVIDEFQEFALTTFAKVVTATRKYGLGLVVANQNLSRVRSMSPDVLSTLLANAGTVVTFRTAPGDAEVLAPMMAPFTADDLVSLAPYECYWRVPADQGPHVVSARTRPLPSPRRSEDDIAALTARIRVPGRALVRPEPPAAWP